MSLLQEAHHPANISRRSLLIGAGILGTGALALPFVGCGNNDKPNTSGDSQLPSNIETSGINVTPPSNPNATQGVESTKAPDKTPTKEATVKQPSFIADIKQTPDPSNAAWRTLSISMGIENTGSGMLTSDFLNQQADILSKSVLTTGEGYQYKPEQGAINPNVSIFRGYQAFPILPPGFRAKAIRNTLYENFQNGDNTSPLLSIDFRVAQQTTGHKLAIPGRVPIDLASATQQIGTTRYPTDLPNSAFKEIGNNASFLLKQPKNNDGKGILIKFNSITQIQSFSNNQLSQRLQGGILSKLSLFSLNVTAENQSIGYNASLEAPDQDNNTVIMRPTKAQDAVNNYSDSLIASHAFIVGDNGTILYSRESVYFPAPFVFLFPSDGDTNKLNNYYNILNPGETKSFNLGLLFPDAISNAKLVIPGLDGLVLNLPKGQ